jgi:hypothetical protein
MSPVLSSALDEFRDVLKTACDDLDEAIADVVPNRFFEAEFDGADYEAGALVVGVDEDIRQAFIDFDWSFVRALHTLKQRLTAGAARTLEGAGGRDP